jgi:diacylglycerol kinase (ATP)
MLKLLKNLPRRVASAMSYSLRGLVQAFKKEESIRLETLSLFILLLILFLVSWPFWKKMTLLAIFFLIPLTELINSAIEDICDLISPEFNEKIRDAKDKSSSAVLIAIIIAIITLIVLLMIP